MLLLILTAASLACTLGVLITLAVTQRTAYQSVTDLHHALSRQEGQLTQFAQNLQQVQAQNQTAILQQQQRHDQILHQLKEYATQLRLDFSEHQLKQLTVLQENLHKNINELSQHILTVLNQNTQSSTQAMQRLNETVAEHLKSISAQVEKRLSEGFEKTTATFQAIIQRLSLIDEAQKKITELSTNVVSLQAILSDKSSRGAFGEVQLSALIRNFLPENQFSLQHTLSNGKRVDCLLFLPEPTGNIAIDAKFPLENYQAMHALAANDPYRKAAEQRFRQDLKKHVDDIADKYILAGETADGAVLFLPAEAVFSEIVSYFPDVVEYAQKKRVWLVSPTTLMAILTTARAVIKDQATREQVHIIQQHLRALGKDFDRFQSRMDNLAKHIEQANKDVTDVHISARKITSHFRKIEAVDEDLVQNSLLEGEKDLTLE
ncbi:MAG: RmuC family protein [Gammaproteobacteria bacterium]|jgi:DNA recombination protein RmuC|nr:RmuC family protein [Gammaproteobacteria bacterium]